MDYPYEIPHSKVKMALLIAAGFGFVAMGCWFVLQPETFADGNSSAWIVGLGIISILFFGLATIFMLRMFLSGKLAIRINDEGITDETTGVAVGLIRWEDIERFEHYNLMGNKFIKVFVRNTAPYYERARGSLARRGMRQNEKSAGTPIVINCNNLKIPRDQLLELLRSELAFQRQLDEGPGLSLRELIRRREELLG